MADKTKYSNDEIFELLSAIAVDIERTNNNLEYLEQKIDRLPEYINECLCHALQENTSFKSLQSINSLLDRIDSKLEDIEEYISINDAKEVSKQLVILRNSFSVLPGDLHNFIGRKFENMQDEINRPKGSTACFRPPLKDLRFKSQLKYFHFTLPLWWLKTEKVKFL